MSLIVEWPRTLPSASNLREHWATRAKRVKGQRTATRLMLSAMLGLRESFGFMSINGQPVGHQRLAVRLVRVAPRKLDDDNLRGAFKAIRDEVAAYFGVDDADPRVEWRYAQAKGKSAVRIELEVGA